MTGVLIAPHLNAPFVEDRVLATVHYQACQALL